MTEITDKQLDEWEKGLIEEFVLLEGLLRDYETGLNEDVAELIIMECMRLIDVVDDLRKRLAITGASSSVEVGHD